MDELDKNEYITSDELDGLDTSVSIPSDVVDSSPSTTSEVSDKTPRTWRQVEIVQDWSFGWTLENVAKFVDGWSCILKYSYIGHDKCYKAKEWEMGLQVPREPHTHLYLKFNYPVSTDAIIARSKAVGCPDGCIKPNTLEKIKNWKGALNYQTHRDVHLPYKHVYDVSEVHSNFDWELECESVHSDEDLRTSNRREKEIVEGIFNGTIKEYNLENHMTHYEMVTYDVAITKAIKRVNEINSLMEERSMEVMFVSGASGIGKDTFAVEWCKRRGLDYYRTNNNPEQPFDNYRGQPVIIWSDARDDVFKPHNLHQLLDNHYGSFQKSRYHDKFIAAKYLIITSIKPLEDWYSKFYANEKEDKTQLYRRIGTKFEMTPEHVFVYDYNGSTKSYAYVGKMPNLYMHEDVYRDTLDKQLAHAISLLGDFSDEFTPAKEGETPDTPFTDDNVNSGNPFVQQSLPNIEKKRLTICY